MARRRKRDDEAVGCAILLIIGLVAFLYLLGTYGNIVFIVIGAIVILILGIAVADAISKEKRIRALELANVDNMDGIVFEHYVGKLLEHRGFRQVEITKSSGDLGVDIIAKKNDLKYAVQVKRHSSKVSRRAVSDAVAGKDHYNCNAAMVITNSYFAAGAKRLAESTACELIDRDNLSEWIDDFQTSKTGNNRKSKSSVDNIKHPVMLDDNNLVGVQEAKYGLHAKPISRYLHYFTPAQWLVLILLGVAGIGLYGCLFVLFVLELIR